ncbi:PIN domain-containing protein [Tessaracoccus caeni]|uniref:PIN domain-containing protein n=1 Tax=Tessaracoccus caeni TaxID=3031239 RepID=UPI0023DC5C0A|nr:type II toxin-antitoxin system VapC family toxin [Tessaracoccus caeni]MDF1490027.1 type II toxin-antitoxin system VapC family toxin [Tessaracoccus caeni]
MTPVLPSRDGLIGLDTNVILRVMLDDDAEQAEIARRVFRDLSPQRLGFITSVTLAEVYWTLSRGKGLPKAACLAAIRLLVEIEVLEFDDGEGAVRALELAEAGADFADALIHGTYEQFSIDEVVTFDRKAARYLGWNLLT